MAVYGAVGRLNEFLLTPADAVSLAGSPAVRQLGLDVGTLLVMCAGAPARRRRRCADAAAPPRALAGVAAATLLDTGLRGGARRGSGYSASVVCSQTLATASELDSLGF